MMRKPSGQDLASGSLAPIECDVCVIGTGPVGLTVARALAERHRSVALLERGPRRAAPQDAATDVAFDRLEYRGATAGRAFGAGGTSTLWGGQLLPVRDADLEERRQIGAPAWPLPHAELAAQFATLEAWLDVRPGSFGLDCAVAWRHPLAGLRWLDWSPRFSKWMPLRRRNLFRAFAPALANPAIRTVFNARTGEWRCRTDDNRRRITSVTARSPNGHAVTVQADAYVVCAGALESARCVLEMNEAAGPLSDGVRDLTGRFLTDHLSMRLARVRITDPAGFKDLFAPVYVGGTLRSLRMELSPDYLSAHGLPALYAHFVFETPANSAFARLRGLFRSLQQGRLAPAAAHLGGLPTALPGVLELLHERLLRRRLPFPRDAEVFLHGDFEQAPRHENRVYLGAPEPGGRRTLRVDWGIGAEAAQVAPHMLSALQRLWAANGLERIARLEPADPPAGGTLDPTNLYDIYHPAGTTRMSADPATGVVDPNLLIHGTSNAYVAGSAVFPSTGAANPTFTAMALGLRLAGFIDARLAIARLPGGLRP